MKCDSPVDCCGQQFKNWRLPERNKSPSLLYDQDVDKLCSFPIINIEKGSEAMAIRLNEDQEMVRMVKEGLKRTGGYCPCRLERSEENKCICQEFREQMADPNFQGYCHCMLYYKE